MDKIQNMDTTFSSDNLKKLIAERDISLGQLSRDTGISVPMLSLMRKGARCKRPTYMTLQKLSIALNVPVDYFYSQN